MSPMLRPVLDADVVAAAFDSPTGASRRLLLAVLDGQAKPLLSTPLLLEREAVLLRPRVLTRVGIGAEEVLAVLDELASICVPVAFDYRWRPAAQDPDDDMAAGARRFGIAVEWPGAVLRRFAGKAAFPYDCPRT